MSAKSLGNEKIDQRFLGFGGCTINLVKIDVIDKIIEEAFRRYKIETGLELTAHIAQFENGTQIIKPLTYDKCLSALF